MTSQAAREDRDRIDEQASYWVVLASERELGAEERRERDAWRAADPRHERTWQELSRTWGDIAALEGLADLAPPPEAEADGAPMHSSLTRFGRHPMAWAAMAAVLFAVVAISLLLRPLAPERYETRLAETRLITLPDGSQVTLAPASTLEVRFADAQRRVALTRGEAFFEVVHDASRPFTVEAGQSRVRVLGTKFDVNFTDQSVRVAVLQGKVEVAHPGGDGAPLRATRLRAGERTEVQFAAAAAAPAAPGPSREMSAGASRPAPPSPAPSPGAWREGRLVYDNVRLADLVSDVNRYYAPGVTMRDPAIGGLRVTAAFKVSEIPAFISALDGVIPVTAREAPDGAFRLDRARR
ncbi:FecR family protein [Novosphingobium decolorationis]|uniref:FecR domain-containing protein n=1 Tax=Novosphingobium decolorationis TaxID=2698673 RepID=A0ABX8E4K8_9SPHN|nr:FecR domain-containing protein [Novosphingobium decolorationis]MED5543971.1 FecR domain-containing protein [Pseudomonadota bacterium]QVM84120.1 FecR domain-containing protein [Novosphingobium decolorationis]